MQIEVIQCNTEVAMETLGKRQICTPNEKKVYFVKPNIVEKLEHAKNKNTLKASQTWLSVWQTWATERKKKMNTSANNSKKKRPKLSDFVEYIINKKSYELARAFQDLWLLVKARFPIRVER